MRGSAAVVAMLAALGACREPERERTRDDCGSAVAQPVAKPAAPPATCDSGYVSVSASCAACSTGVVTCWANQEDQTRHVIAGIADAIEVLGNSELSCARTRLGHVTCWGPYLANIALVPDRNGLAAIALPERALSLAVGNHHACAVLASHQLACWGDNTWLQVGMDSAQGVFPPTLVPGLRASKLSAAGAVTCVVDLAGHAQCTGYNKTGALGRGVRSDVELWQPVLDHVVDISTDGDRTCARRDDDSVWCWGDYMQWRGKGEPPAPLAPRRLRAPCPPGPIATVTRELDVDSESGVAVVTPPLRALSVGAGYSIDDAGALYSVDALRAGQPPAPGRPAFCADP